MRVKRMRNSGEEAVGIAGHSAEAGGRLRVLDKSGEGPTFWADAAEEIRKGEIVVLADVVEIPVTVELRVETACPSCGVSLATGIPIMTMDELRSNTINTALQTLGTTLQAHSAEHHEGGVG